mgnify:CR=1 FL=1
MERSEHKFVTECHPTPSGGFVWVGGDEMTGRRVRYQQAESAATLGVGFNSVKSVTSPRRAP